jgi:hypothetical protein
MHAMLCYKRLSRRVSHHVGRCVRRPNPSVEFFQPAFLAASAPFLPNAVRVFAGKWEMVFLDFATAAAFLIFFLAAARCFSVLIFVPKLLTVIRSITVGRMYQKRLCHL